MSVDRRGALRCDGCGAPFESTAFDGWLSVGPRPEDLDYCSAACKDARTVEDALLGMPDDEARKVETV